MVKKFIYENWSYIMDHRISPLKNIKDNNVRFMILQLLAWMWSITFSLWFGSIWIFGFTTIAHMLVLTVIMITVLTFESAKRKPFLYFKSGYHTSSRSRAIYFKGKRIELDPQDKGGEHD